MDVISCACGCGAVISAFDAIGRPRKWLHGHQGRHQKPPVPLVECACGCGCTRPILDAKGRPARYIAGHQQRRKTEVQKRASVHALNKVRPATPWNKGRSYTIAARSEYANRSAWMMALRRAYGESCMRCGWNEASCDGHHITPRRKGGKHLLSNGIILCPNCHRLVETGRILADDLIAIRERAIRLNPAV